MIVTFPEDSPFLQADNRAKRWAIPYHYEALNSRVENLIVKNRSLIEGKRVLDLGCHFGSFAYACLKHGAAHVVGVDSEAGLVQQGRRLFKNSGVPASRYSLHREDLVRFLETSPAKRFDTLLCFGVFYYLPDPMRALCLMAKAGKNILLDTFTAYYAAAMAKSRDDFLTKVKPDTYDLPLTVHTLTQARKKDYTLTQTMAADKGKPLSLLTLPTIAALEMFFKAAGLKAHKLSWDKYTKNKSVTWQDFNQSQTKQNAHWADTYHTQLRVSYVLERTRE